MTATTPNYGFPFPSRTDTPDVALHMQNLANAVDTALHNTDTNVAANALAAQRTALINTLMGSGRVGYAPEANNPVATTSTSPVFPRDSGGNILGSIVFTAPPSGIVTVLFGMGVNAGAANTATVGLEVLSGNVKGSGSVILPVSNATQMASTVAATVPISRLVTVAGLTPGSQYNACMLWQTASASVSVAGAHIWTKATPEIA